MSNFIRNMIELVRINGGDDDGLYDELRELFEGHEVLV
jgi:hypothetical protein